MNIPTQFPEIHIPVLATGGFVLFPGTELPIPVRKPTNIAAAKYAKNHGGWALVIPDLRDGASEVEIASLAKTGVIGKVEDLKEGKNGRITVLFRGLERFRIHDVTEEGGILFASATLLSDKLDADKSTIDSLTDNLIKTAIEVLELFPNDMNAVVQELKKITDPAELSHTVAQYLSLSRSEALQILEITSLKSRLLSLLELLVSRKEALKVQTQIHETLSANVGKRHREAILREQLKVIQAELGEGTDEAPAGDYKAKIEAAGMTEPAKKVALRELSRLERMGEQSAESHVIRNYLDLLCDMPWNKISEGIIDLEAAKRVLDRDHYGLKKVKKRIIEHLAVMKLQSEKRGSIVLLVGPPGVGKTSLGKSIAEALGREFVRISLGGVRDDADIRGHRRTYVGALPGRIIDGIRRAKTKDPVFVLDEIDKTGRGWGGDPASALLEVLDPEQNNSFHDHYLDVPFDLSQALFICTANSKETIPGPLLDRMEVIDLSGYTTDEKFHIAKDHLVAQELKLHGLREGQVQLKDSALLKVIEGYTREAGVRSLKRELARIARAAAARVVTDPEETVIIEVDSLNEILGPAKFELDEMNTDPVPGVVTGMAWTPVGGDVLFVEAATIPGDGKVVVTGQLGDVMKESSQIAVALSRSRLEAVAKSVLFKDRDIHVHVPGGAIPKDGPSAGITMFTAIASMMLGVPVEPTIAMTGEITLRGKVLPVGGIKEKVLAAARYGIKEILLPVKNMKDLDDVPEEIKNTVTFTPVGSVDEVLTRMFGTSIPQFSLQNNAVISQDKILQGEIAKPHLH